MIEPVEPFEKHCEAEFQFLASNGPEKLVALLADDLPNHLLTYAAEYAGDIKVDVPNLKENLLGLLLHKCPGVREGAIYGIAGLIDSNPKKYGELIAFVLKHTDSNYETSPGVRLAASGFQKSFEVCNEQP